MADTFGEWLAAQVCVTCGENATHNQGGKRVCNAHLVNGPRAPRAFALND